MRRPAVAVPAGVRTRLPGARRTLPGLLVLLALAGCGNAEEQQGTSTSVADRAEVVVQPDGPDGRAERETIECTAATDQCRRLREADFEAPATDTACTQIYGGPATATVTGRAGGRAIRAEFDLTNGCQIDRWREFSWLLGDPPG